MEHESRYTFRWHHNVWSSVGRVRLFGGLDSFSTALADVDAELAVFETVVWWQRRLYTQLVPSLLTCKQETL
jgi:hypothetical protein